MIKKLGLQSPIKQFSTKNLYLIGIIFLLIGTFLGYAITSFFTPPKRPTQKNSGFSGLPTGTPLPTSSPSPTPADTASFTLYLGQALLVLQKDLAMELPNQVSIEDTRITIHGNTYRLVTELNPMQSPCDILDDRMNCYSDKEIKNMPYVQNFKIWRDKNGVAILNPQSIQFESTWLDRVVIYKEKPNHNFTQSEVDMWIEMFNHLTLID